MPDAASRTGGWPRFRRARSHAGHGLPTTRDAQPLPAAATEGAQTRSRLRLRTLALVLVLDLACLAVATYPVVTTLTSRLPALADPLTHLWTMRWYKAALLTGQSPFHCPNVQYPFGAPLGLLPPMQLQTLLYIPLSSVIHNDILCYN